MPFIAGRYVAQYGGVALGQTAEGIRLSHKFFTREIKGDAGAETVQDEINRGCEVMLDMRLIEADLAAVKAAIWPWAATYLDMGVMGALAVGSNKAKTITLTAVAGTTAVPASITFPLCMLAGGFPVDTLFGPDLREYPMRMRVFPGEVVSAGNSLGVFGTQT